MRTFFLILCGLLTTTMAKSQEVIDNFQVGPYEVDYMGKGDVNFRLKKNINLYEYFKLQKDTIIAESKKVQPIKKGFEVGVTYSMPRFGVKGAFNSFGVYGSAKTRVSNNTYLNYGGKIAISYGHYNEEVNNLKDVLFEVGVPLSVEFANLNKDTSSFFASVGFTPAYYTTLSAKENKDGKDVDADKKSGLYVAPKVELGGYIPVNNHFLKLGLFGEYRINCTKAEDNIFKQRIGRAFVGANIGYVF